MIIRSWIFQDSTSSEPEGLDFETPCPFLSHSSANNVCLNMIYGWVSEITKMLLESQRMYFFSDVSLLHRPPCRRPRLIFDILWPAQLTNTHSRCMTCLVPVPLNARTHIHTESDDVAVDWWNRDAHGSLPWRPTFAFTCRAYVICSNGETNSEMISRRGTAACVHVIYYWSNDYLSVVEGLSCR